MKKAASIFTAITCALSGILMPNIPATAWTLTPMKLEKNLKPGEDFTDVLVIDNSGSSDTKRYEIKIVDWTLDNKGELKYMEPGVIPQSFAKEIICTPMQFKCGPSERKLIRYTLHVPEDASPGEHTVGIQALEVVIPPKDTSTGRINIGVSVKCGFLCAMSINIPQSSVKQIEPVSLEYIAGSKELAQSVDLTVKNTGNCRVRPLWSFVISDANGSKVFEQVPQDHLILREAERTISIPIKENLAPGKYKVTGKLDQGISFPVQELEKEFEISNSPVRVSELAK